MSIPTKAMMLTTAVVLAACSRNPRPGIDDTGRADTTMTDTAMTPRVHPRVVDTTQILPTPLPSPSARPDSQIRPPMPSADSVHTDTTGVHKVDSTRTPPRAAGDSSVINRNLPDSTGQPPKP